MIWTSCFLCGSFFRCSFASRVQRYVISTWCTHDNEIKKKVSQIIITNSVGGPNLELGSSNN
jgi:hypothetical protein